MTRKFDADIARLFERISGLELVDLPDEETFGELELAVARLVRKKIRLPGSLRDGPIQPYGRRLLHHDLGTGIACIAMIWPPGAVTPIHDHGTWGLVGVLEGELEVTNYTRVEAPGLQGGFVLAPEPLVRAMKGDVATVHPNWGEIHRIRNPGSETAVSIHLYGELKASHQIYDLERGSIERKPMPKLSTPIEADA